MHRTVFTRTALAVTLAAGALSASVTTASAQDRLNFVGSANLRDQPQTGGANLLIDFLAGTPPTTPGTPIGNVRAVPTLSGAFAVIAPNTPGTIRDIVVDANGFLGAPGPGQLPPNTGLPLTNFLEIGPYRFSLTGGPNSPNNPPFGFGPITLVATPTGTLGFLGWRGIVTGGVFGNTGVAYTGTFTAEFAGQTPQQVFNTVNQGGTLPVSFSAEILTQVVPEPSTYALMLTGLGFMGVVASRRRRTQA